MMFSYELGGGVILLERRWAMEGVNPACRVVTGSDGSGTWSPEGRITVGNERWVG